MPGGWISVIDWRRFQHYDPEKRQPPWIKNYTDLVHDDDYLSLPAGTRSVLHGIWIVYASSRCRLRFDARLLSRRLSLKVSTPQLVSLCQAGFIQEVASKRLAEGYHAASARAHASETETEVETEEDLDLPISTSTKDADVARAREPDPSSERSEERETEEADETVEVLRGF